MKIVEGGEFYMNRVHLIFLLMVTCLTAGQTIAQTVSRNDKAEQEIKRINEDVDEAFLRSDVKLLDRLLADNSLFIGRDGSVGNKSEVLEIFRSATIKFSEIKAEVENLRIYENKVAVVIGRARTKGRRFEKEIDHLVRYTRVYLKQKGRWQLVSEQVTRIEE